MISPSMLFTDVFSAHGWIRAASGHIAQDAMNVYYQSEIDCVHLSPMLDA